MLEYLFDNLDQLYAESVHLYRRGEFDNVYALASNWSKKDEPNHIVMDLWAGKIRDYLEADNYPIQVCTETLASLVLDIDNRCASYSNVLVRISRALRALRYVPIDEYEGTELDVSTKVSNSKRHTLFIRNFRFQESSYGDFI